jgi:uncharacterized protein (TIGR02001 family)
MAMLMLCSTNALAYWGGMIGVGNDNIHRGSSLTEGRPGWMADIHYVAEEFWVVGVAASAERPRDQGAAAQLSFYVDRGWRLNNDWSARLGAVHYESPWNHWSDALRYNELTMSISWRERWQLAVATSPDSPGITESLTLRRNFVTYIESTYQHPLAGPLFLHAGVGYADLRRVSDRSGAYASAGLRYALGRAQIYSTMFWTDRSAQSYATSPDQERRWVTSLVWNF